VQLQAPLTLDQYFGLLNRTIGNDTFLDILDKYHSLNKPIIGFRFSEALSQFQTQKKYADLLKILSLDFFWDTFSGLEYEDPTEFRAISTYLSSIRLIDIFENLLNTPSPKELLSSIPLDYLQMKFNHLLLSTSPEKHAELQATQTWFKTHLDQNLCYQNYVFCVRMALLLGNDLVSDALSRAGSGCNEEQVNMIILEVEPLLVDPHQIWLFYGNIFKNNPKYLNAISPAVIKAMEARFKDVESVTQYWDCIEAYSGPHGRFTSEIFKIILNLGSEELVTRLFSEFTGTCLDDFLNETGSASSKYNLYQFLKETDLSLNPSMMAAITQGIMNRKWNDKTQLHLYTLYKNVPMDPCTALQQLQFFVDQVKDKKIDIIYFNKIVASITAYLPQGEVSVDEAKKIFAFVKTAQVNSEENRVFVLTKLYQFMRVRDADPQWIMSEMDPFLAKLSQSKQVIDSFEPHFILSGVRQASPISSYLDWVNRALTRLSPRLNLLPILLALPVEAQGDFLNKKLSDKDYDFCLELVKKSPECIRFIDFTLCLSDKFGDSKDKALDRFRRWVLSEEIAIDVLKAKLDRFLLDLPHHFDEFYQLFSGFPNWRFSYARQTLLPLISVALTQLLDRDIHDARLDLSGASRLCDSLVLLYEIIRDIPVRTDLSFHPEFSISDSRKKIKHAIRRHLESLPFTHYPKMFFRKILLELEITTPNSSLEKAEKAWSPMANRGKG
jgi:hypothetical protein